jgi:hypothetical protein
MLPAFRRRRDYDEPASDTYVDRDGRLRPLSYAIRDHACSVGVDPLNFAAVAPVAQLDRASASILTVGAQDSAIPEWQKVTKVVGGVFADIIRV